VNVVVMLTEFTVRSRLVNTVGLGKIGQYNPIIAFSALIVDFILPAISIYLLPRLSTAKSDPEICIVVNEVLRVSTFFILPLILLGIFFRETAIKLVYTKEFLFAATILPYHFIGRLFESWDWALGSIFVPTGRIIHLVVMIILKNAFGLIIVLLFVVKLGIYSYLLKFLIPPILFSTAYYFYFRSVIGFRLEKKTALLIIYSLISSIIISFIKFPIIMNVIILILVLSFLYFLLEQRERDFLIQKIKSFL
jgi:PST family polysaccharide transporter